MTALSHVMHTDNQAQVMVEIGALAGYSAVRFASKIKELSGPSVRYYSFEIGPGFADIASQVCS